MTGFVEYGFDRGRGNKLSSDVVSRAIEDACSPRLDLDIPILYRL